MVTVSCIHSFVLEVIGCVHYSGKAKVSISVAKDPSFHGAYRPRNAVIAINPSREIWNEMNNEMLGSQISKSERDFLILLAMKCS